jgi:hypothetical protein
MILIVPLFLRIVAGKFVNAMALWPFILVKNIETKESLVTIHHEKIHIRQQLELLIIPFYILYLGFYLLYRMRGHKHMQAYLNIPFEKEAYANESELDYLKTRKLWGWKRYLSD